MKTPMQMDTGQKRIKSSPQLTQFTQKPVQLLTEFWHLSLTSLQHNKIIVWSLRSYKKLGYVMTETTKQRPINEIIHDLIIVRATTYQSTNWQISGYSGVDPQRQHSAYMTRT